MDEMILVAEDRTQVQSGNEVGELKVVQGVDANGNVQAKTPTPNMPLTDLLKFNVNTRVNVLENFMTNFNKSFKNAKNFRLYNLNIQDQNIQKAVGTLGEMLANPSEYKQALKDMRVNPYDYREKQTVTPELEEKLSEIGISSQDLPKEQLKKLLSFQYTDVLYIKTPVGENNELIEHQARIALRTDPTTGELSIETRAVKNELNLDQPFLGYELTETDKMMLRDTGNLGHTVELTPNNGEPFMAFVSVDKQTNELVYVPTKDVRISETIAGLELTDEQREHISSGYAVPLEGLTSKNGKSYDAIVQYSASKRGLDFVFPGLGKSFGQRKDGIPQTIGGYELSVKQQNALAVGKTLYLKGLVNKKTGASYNSYVQYNKAEGRLKFSRFNPEKTKKSGIEQDVASKGIKTGMQKKQGESLGKSIAKGASKGVTL